MMKIEMEEIRIELLYKKLENALSEEESTRVEKWLETPAHQSYFEYLKKFYQLTEDTGVSEQELQEAWKKMHRRVYLRSKNSVKLFLKICAVAASLLIGVGFWLLLPKSSAPVIKVEKMTSICPGKYNAILELADGRVYDLKNSNRVNNKIKDYILVDSGRLDYSQRDSVYTEKLSYNKLVVPRGGEFQVVLADGTKVWLNAESQLKYPEVFVGKTREVYLEGEAYFEVTKNPEQPFVVYSGIQKITVLGTSFGITDYAEDQEISTTLVEGKVKVEYPEVLEQFFTLEPGSRILCNLTDHSVEQQKVDVREFVAWKDGKYIFARKRLEEMLATLSRWYDFKIFYQNPEVKDVLFSGELMRFENFNDILSIIGKSSDLKFTVQEHVVIVSK